MPARPPLVSDCWDLVLEIKERYPTDRDVFRLANQIADLHYGLEIARAFSHSGVDGVRANQLLREHRQLKEREGLTT